MDSYLVLPDKAIESGAVSDRFISLGIYRFLDACRYVHHLPYGYNSDRDDLMILFEEKMGSCTTKHAIIASLAEEASLPVAKKIGIYAMTEAIVTGTDKILKRYGLPYVPMVHCFLAFDRYRVDLTEGNNNGKNRSIDNFLHVEQVPANISAKEEYRCYRQALKEVVLARKEMQGVEIKQILHAREEGLALLKSHVLE